MRRANVGAALASWLGGEARDVLGSDGPAFLASAVLAVCAGGLALGISAPARRRDARPAA